jgi:hypothetical protein
MSRKDQLTAPMPPVVFATQEAANRIVADIKAKYDEAAHYAAAQGGIALQLAEDIVQLEREIADHEQKINEKQVAVIEKDGEKRTAEMQAKAARDVAKGYADMLAAAGFNLPPYGGELSHNPDGNLRNLNAAHDELNGVGGHS